MYSLRNADRFDNYREITAKFDSLGEYCPQIADWLGDTPDGVRCCFIATRQPHKPAMQQSLALPAAGEFQF